MRLRWTSRTRAEAALLTDTRGSAGLIEPGNGSVRSGAGATAPTSRTRVAVWQPGRPYETRWPTASITLLWLVKVLLTSQGGEVELLLQVRRVTWTNLGEVLALF